MDVKKLIKSDQEQAVASWINYLNQLRIDALLSKLNQQDVNLERAMAEIDSALKEARLTITSNRGGDRGIHGFLAEIAEKGIHNARELIDGNPADMEWLNDNGPADLLRAGTPIQQKFYQSGGMFSLNAVSAHLEHYPDFISEGGKYQIPKDQYEAVKYLQSLTEKDAHRILSDSGDYSMRQWRRVNEFFKECDVRFEDLEPADINYSQAQKGVIENTFEDERKSLKDRDQQNRDAAYEESKPSFGEGAKATVVSAGIEGGTAFVMAVTSRLKDGRTIKDLSGEDWTDIMKETGAGSAKGAVRGASIYVLTNYTATPASVASSLVTASFSVADLAHEYRLGNLTQLELIEKAQIASLDAAVSAVSSLLGQTVIPVPVVGAVIGNTVGTIAYNALKDAFDERERDFLDELKAQQDLLDAELQSRYAVFLDAANEDIHIYLDLLGNAFAPDVEKAFCGSIELAKHLGVSEDEILASREDIDEYFLC